MKRKLVLINRDENKLVKQAQREMELQKHLLLLS